MSYVDCSNYPNTISTKNGYPLIKDEFLEIIIKVYDDYCPKALITND